MLKNLVQITLLRLTSHLNEQLFNLAKDTKMGDNPVAPKDIMTTLLTIEHAQREYLEANDNHRKAISFNLART
jgi:hypothetical protein